MSQLEERSEVSMVVGIFRGDHPSKAPHREKNRVCRKETGEIIVEDRKTKHTHTIEIKKERSEKYETKKSGLTEDKKSLFFKKESNNYIK